MALPTPEPTRLPDTDSVGGSVEDSTGSSAVGSVGGSETGSEAVPADGSATAPDPDANLGWSLAVVLRRWHERVEAVLADVPHGSRGYHVLGAVSLDEPPTQAALAERLLIDRSVMTYLLDDLEEADLVRRRVDPGDRRVRRVCATAHGREVLAGARERVEQVEGQVLHGLDASTRGLFRDIAQRAAVAIQESSPTTDPCAAVRQVVGEGSDESDGSASGGAGSRKAGTGSGDAEGSGGSGGSGRRRRAGRGTGN